MTLWRCSKICNLRCLFVTLRFWREVTSTRKKNKHVCFVLLSFFRNFGRNRRISLYKGSLEDWGKMGYELATVLNSTFFHLKVEVWLRILLWNAFNEHPMMCHQPYYGSSSGAKVIILFQLSKSIHTFFFRACSLFLQSLWHLIWHLPEKCVLGYVLLP